MLFGNDRGKLTFFGLKKLAELEHNCHTLGQRHGRPAGKRGFRDLNGCIEVASGGQAHRLGRNTEGWIEHISESIGFADEFCSADVVVDDGLAH